jgi:hypothetical protein
VKKGFRVLGFRVLTLCVNNNTDEVYDQTHYRVAVKFFPLQSHRYACKSFWGMQGSNFPVAAFYDTIIQSLLTIYVYIIS